MDIDIQQRLNDLVDKPNDTKKCLSCGELAWFSALCSACKHLQRHPGKISIYQQMERKSFETAAYICLWSIFTGCLFLPMCPFMIYQYEKMRFIYSATLEKPSGFKLLTVTYRVYFVVIILILINVLSWAISMFPVLFL